MKLKVVYHDGKWEVRDGESVVRLRLLDGRLGLQGGTRVSHHEVVAALRGRRQHEPQRTAHSRRRRHRRDWAVRREFGLRWDAYHGGLVREVGLAEARAARRLLAPWLCKDPEGEWIADMERQHSVHWERCVP